MKRLLLTFIGTWVLIASVVATAFGGDGAPMPQTRGMQGMDPALHEQWAKDGQQDPYADCTPNAQAAAHQAKHPMPQTRGMAGMDPKAHEVDCPQAAAQTSEKPVHVHKGPGS